MAKKKRSSFRISGKLGNETHVDSKAYGPHVRANRGTIKPAKLNKVFKQNALDMPKANQQAKVIFDALNPYRDGCKDGRWWPGLLGLFKSHYQAGRPPDYSILKGNELNEKCKLDTLVPGLHAEVVMKKSEAHVRLVYKVPPSFRGAGITMYGLSVIGVFIDREALAAVTEVVDFGKLKCKDKVAPLVATLARWKNADVVAVCVKIGGIYEDGGPSYGQGMTGMKIVRVSEL